MTDERCRRPSSCRSTRACRSASAASAHSRAVARRATARTRSRVRGAAAGRRARRRARRGATHHRASRASRASRRARRRPATSTCVVRCSADRERRRSRRRSRGRAAPTSTWAALVRDARRDEAHIRACHGGTSRTVRRRPSARSSRLRNVAGASARRSSSSSVSDGGEHLAVARGRARRACRAPRARARAPRRLPRRRRLGRRRRRSVVSPRRSRRRRAVRHCHVAWRQRPGQRVALAIVPIELPEQLDQRILRAVLGERGVDRESVARSRATSGHSAANSGSTAARSPSAAADISRCSATRSVTRSARAGGSGQNGQSGQQWPLAQHGAAARTAGLAIAAAGTRTATATEMARRSFMSPIGAQRAERDSRNLRIRLPRRIAGSDSRIASWSTRSPCSGRADLDRRAPRDCPQRLVDMLHAAVAGHPGDAQGGDHDGNVACTTRTPDDHRPARPRA